MRIDAAKPVFSPLTITLESEQELRAMTAFFGNLPGLVADKMGFPSGLNRVMYDSLSRTCRDRGVTESTVRLNISAKE
jgi:hypothetical protein